MNNMPRESKIFAPDSKNDRPLFAIFFFLSFLASLCLLSALAAIRIGGEWSAGLNHKATIMIYDMDKDNSDTDQKYINTAREIILQNPQIKSAKTFDREYSRSLLKPWLGNIDLPDDMPVPRIIEVELKQAGQLDTKRLEFDLENAGINAEIDTHENWQKNIGKSLGLAKLFGWLVILTSIAIITAITIFASRAFIYGQKQTIDVLHQIGAPPKMTARLLAISLGTFGIKASFLGSLFALIVFILVKLLFFIQTDNSIISAFNISLSEILLLLLLPALFTLMIGIISWRSVMDMLGKEIYS